MKKGTTLFPHVYKIRSHALDVLLADSFQEAMIPTAPLFFFDGGASSKTRVAHWQVHSLTISWINVE